MTQSLFQTDMAAPGPCRPSNFAHQQPPFTGQPSPRRTLSAWLAALLLFVAAAALAVWALSSSRFRDVESSVTGALCLPLAASIALGVVGLGIGTPWGAAARWFAVALIGQAVTLQMIDAGRRLHYQHYWPVAQLAQNPGTALLLLWLLAQAVAVIIYVARAWRPIWMALVTAIGLRRTAIVVLAVAAVAAPLSASPAAYFSELLLSAALQFLSLLTLIPLARSIPAATLPRIQRLLDRLGDSPSEHGMAPRPARPDPVVICAAMWVTLASTFFNFVIYERHPHIQDEVIYLHQARILAQGKLTVSAPRAPQAFDLYLMDADRGRWFATPPAGWPAALALGVLVGAPSLVNPVLAGANLCLVAALLRRIYDDRRLARIAVFLLACSPWYIFMAMSYLTHTFTLTCVLVAALGVHLARDPRAPVAWSLAAGAAVGVLSLIRPLDAVIVGSVLALWAVGVAAPQRRRVPFKACCLMACAAIAVAALVLPYNRELTGNPATFPIMRYIDRYWWPNANALGFGPDRGMGWGLDPFPGHGPLDAAVNTNLNLYALNAELFGWAGGSLLLVVLALASGIPRKNDLFMLMLLLAFPLFHCLYWYSGGPDFGARYWYPVILPCAALTVRGIQRLGQAFDPPLSHDQRDLPALHPRVAVAVATMMALSLLAYIPWRATDKYFRYLNMRPDVRRIARERAIGNALVLVRGPQMPDYAGAAAYNPMDFDAPVPVYAWDRSREVRRAAIESYPNRPVWILNGPTVTGRGYDVVAGPLTPDEALALEDQTPPPPR